MCGIFGVITGERVMFDRTKKYTNFLADATIASAVRGIDSTGIFAIKRDGSAEILKRPIAPWDFLSQTKTQDLYSSVNDYNIMIGHVRSPTRGMSSYSNAHPFHHGNVMLVHNGTLANVSSMNQTWKYGTDSEHIAAAMDAADNPIDVLEKINGAFALAWYDLRTDSTYLARNNQRELHFAESTKDGTIIIASEWKMLDWLATRHGIEVKEIWQVEANTMVQIPRKAPTKSTIISFKEYKEPVSIPPVWVNTNGCGSNGGLGSRYRTDTKVLPDYSLNPQEIKTIGVEVGKEIIFQVLDVFLSKAKSKAGILEGVMLDNPWHMVRAAGVDIRKIFNSKEHALTGRVVGVIDIKSLNPIIVVTDVDVDNNKPSRAVGSAKTHIRSVGLLDKTFWPEGRNKIPELPEKDNTIIQNLNGPGGRLIDFVQWKLLTKEGCGYCQGDITIEGSNKILWIGDAPICPTCAIESNGNHH
jgi:predicted glutamine amidotransferase